MPDVREMLERAAAEPAAGPDTEAILRRARTMDRRRKAAWVAAPLLVLLAVLVLAPGLSPRPSVLLGPGDADRQAFRLPPAGEARPEFLGDGTPVFVVHDREGSVTVVEAIDSARMWGIRNLVAWCPTAGWFEEFMRGSRFTPAGQWLGGPAPEGLASYEARLVDGMVQVGPRRPRQPRIDTDFTPAGSSCEERPIDLVTHANSVQALTPEDAARAGRPGWVPVRGALVHDDDEGPRLCSSAWDDTAPQCPADAPLVHGVDGRDAIVQWRSLQGWFLVRFSGGAVTDVLMWQGSIGADEQTGPFRRFGYIHRIAQRDDGSWWVEFEQAEWLEGVPEDAELIRRPHPDEVTDVPLADEVEILGDIRLNQTGPGLVPMTLDDLLVADDLKTIPFWITVDRDTGTVVRIEEQHVP